MKSRVTMEFDFDSNEPYLKVVEELSPDLRDQMFKRFREMFGYESNLCRVDFTTHANNEDGKVVYTIKPLKTSQFFNITSGGTTNNIEIKVV